MQYFDLSMPIDSKTPVYPSNAKPEIRQIATIGKEGWDEKQLCFSSHFGTHIDAPAHMIDGGKTLDQFPIEMFIGQAIVLDARGQREITVPLDQVKAGDRVFLCTGHSEHAQSKTYYTDNPVLSKKTAQALIDKRIKIIGIDSWTPDNAPFDIHKMFLKRDILIVENLVNLTPLIGKRFSCTIAPLPIADADGAPCRVIALVGNSH